MNKAKSNEEFIRDAQKVHGNRYDYSKTNYSRALSKVCITCEKHGDFFITPSDHLRGSGCPKCAGRYKTTEDFVIEAKLIHGDKYDYSNSNYIGSYKKIRIDCPKHGEFWQRASAHISGQGCPKCADNQKISKEEFIRRAKEIHGNKYDYSEVEYETNYKKVKIICPKHGPFLQTPHTHLKGCGCPRCVEWKLEKEVEDLLKENNIVFEREKKFSGMVYKSELKCDFYLPEYNIVIECQGIQHFKPTNFCGNNEKAKENFKIECERDKVKREYCIANNIKILYYNHISKVKSKEKVIHTKKKLLSEIYAKDI